MHAIDRKIDPAFNQCNKNKGKLSAFCLVFALGVIFLLNAHAVQAKIVEPISAEFVKQMSAKDFPAQDYVDYIRALIVKYAKITCA